MDVCGKERHLRFRITTIGAVCVCLDELPDSEAIRGFTGRDSSVVAHELVSLFDLFSRARAVAREWSVVLETARSRMLESAPRCLRIVTRAVDRNTAGADLQGHVARALRALR